MNIRALIVAVAAIAVASCAKEREPMPWELDPDFGKPAEVVTDAEVGKPLPLWSEGYFDIHAVNTGRGECTFFIMPDGTTMLIDAGEVTGSASYPAVPQKPNAGVRPIDTYYKYISHFLPSKCGGKIDYAMLTHFHNDHMGSMTNSSWESNVEGKYRKTGMYGLYDLIHFSKYVDRIYPDYNDKALETTDFTAGYNQVADFAKYNASKNGLVCERFDLGSSTQFRPLYDPDRYDFRVDNVASCGEICIAGLKQDIYGTAAHAENGMSNSVFFTYGKFNYLTCGDAGQNGKIEQPLARAMNVRIEAMKASHHMSVSCMTPAAMAIWTPRVIVTQSFYERDDQPNVSVLEGLYTSYVSEKNLYFTNVVEAQQKAHDVYAKASGINGHVVIRVAPGGDSFYVYMLSDNDFSYTVTKIDGPFKCE